MRRRWAAPMRRERRTVPAELDGPIVVAQLDVVLDPGDAPRLLLLRLVAVRPRGLRRARTGDV